MPWNTFLLKQFFCIVPLVLVLALIKYAFTKRREKKFFFLCPLSGLSGVGGPNNVPYVPTPPLKALPKVSHKKNDSAIKRGRGKAIITPDPGIVSSSPLIHCILSID